MNQIIQYIELHLEDDLSIKQLADVAGYSEYYFIRLFKSYTNQTVMEFTIQNISEKYITPSNVYSGVFFCENCGRIYS
ncbi:MAG: helix-turn-helix transcriptional regulator [Lachnospiraceae bacterium]|nr:helix-turn-helix transcriptional regulator [Lachnospiraceae bacterium]